MLEEELRNYIENARDTVRQKFGEEFLELFDQTTSEIFDDFLDRIGVLDLENCDLCKKIAKIHLDTAKKLVDAEISCYERCTNYLKELLESEEPVEPPCTSFCPVIQYKKHLSFETAGSIEWLVKTYKHSPNCRFAHS